MKCYLCDSKMSPIDGFINLQPDKYQSLVDNKSLRTWYSCDNCDLRSQDVNLSDGEKSIIYDMYRSLGLRAYGIKDTFNQVINIPLSESENKKRCDLFQKTFLYKNAKILDIGSGLGVFPYELLSIGFRDICCVETNPDSIEFINDNLGIKCYNNFDSIHNKFDIICLVHVLEHISDPVLFLSDIRERFLNFNGAIFIEVPFDWEFNNLESSNDEFNSLHVNFFNQISLNKILQKAGYQNIILNEIFEYEHRGLTRLIMASDMRSS